MKTKFEIKTFGGSLLFTYEGESLKEAVIAAVKQRAYLQGAYLQGAYLQGAYLQGAYLQGAYGDPLLDEAEALIQKAKGRIADPRRER